MIVFSDNWFVNVVEDLRLRSHMAMIVWTLSIEGVKVVNSARGVPRCRLGRRLDKGRDFCINRDSYVTGLV